MSVNPKKIKKYFAKNKLKKIVELLKSSENIPVVLNEIRKKELEILPEMCSGIFHNNENIRVTSEAFINELLVKNPEETLFHLLMASMDNTFKFEVNYSYGKIEEKYKKNAEKIQGYVNFLKQRGIKLSEKFISLVKKNIAATPELFDGRPNFNWRIKSSHDQDVYSMDIPFFEKWMREFFFPLFGIFNDLNIEKVYYQEILKMMDFLFGCAAVRVSVIVRNVPTLDDYKLLYISFMKLHSLIDDKNDLIEQNKNYFSDSEIKRWDKNDFYLSATEEEIRAASKKKINFKTSILENVVVKPDRSNAVKLFNFFSGNYLASPMK